MVWFLKLCCGEIRRREKKFKEKVRERARWVAGKWGNAGAPACLPVHWGWAACAG
jgi:hypothetical protein